MYKKTPSCPVFWIKAQNPPLRSKPYSFPAALIWASFLRLCLSFLLIHASPKHVVSPDKRERGENKRAGGLKEKMEGGKRKRKGLIVHFNYQPWLVSAVVGNYTTQLQETAPLHPIKVGTEGCAAACFLSLSCSHSFLPGLLLFLLFPPFLTARLLSLSLFSTLPLQLTLFNRQVEYIK